MNIDATVEMPNEISITVKSTLTISEWKSLRDSISSVAGSGVEIGQFYAKINQVVETALKPLSGS